VSISTAWVPYVIGALTQLLFARTWATEDADVLADVRGRALALIGQFAQCLGPVAPLFQLWPDGTLHVSVDGGGTWLSVLTFAPPPGGAGVAWRGADTFISNGVPAPLVWNGGANVPVLTKPGGVPLLGTPGGSFVYNGPNPNLPISA
jgi:hypothetical protein